jgi:hypothetical protein
MPWCPQCGAQYRDGFSTCAKCAAALVDEPPAVSRPDWRESLPPTVRRLASRLRKVATDVTAAIRHGRHALQLLRRNPSLVLLPLAITCFNVVERLGGEYYTYHHTAWGRDMARRIEQTALPADVPRARFEVIRQSILASPVDAPSLDGLIGAALASKRKVNESGPGTAEMVITAPGVLVVMLPAAFLLAGYYAVVGAAVAAGGVSWQCFFPSAKRRWWRFWLFSVLFLVVAYWPLYVVALLPLELWDVASLWPRWVAPVLGVLLSLSLYAIVASDLSVIAAIKQSIRLVWRTLATALTLWAGFLALQALLITPLTVLARSLAGPNPALRIADFSIVPWLLAKDGWTSVLGVWLCLTMFCWYHHVSAAARGQSGEALGASC